MKTRYFHYFLLALMMATDCYSQVTKRPQLTSNQLSSAAESTTKSQKEVLNMKDNMPSPSRPAPPQVGPIIHKNIRYEQDMQSYSHGGDQPGGYMVAVDPTSNERLWMIKFTRFLFTMLLESIHRVDTFEE